MTAVVAEWTVSYDGICDDETAVVWFTSGVACKIGWPRKYSHVDFPDSTWKAPRPHPLKKAPLAHLTGRGGGSKIKSAVTVCSLDRGNHVLLELDSNAKRDLTCGEERRPGGQGFQCPTCGILSTELYFSILHKPGRWRSVLEQLCLCWLGGLWLLHS